MRMIKPLVSLLAMLSGMAISLACFAQSNQPDSTPAINVPALLTDAGYKYEEVRKGLWKVSDTTYRGENLRHLIVFLEPNPANQSLRISFRLGFLREAVETMALKEKLKDLSTRLKPTEFVLSEPVVFVVTELPADKLNKDTLGKAIKGLAEVSDRVFPELAKFLELDLEASGAGYGAGAPGPGGLSPSVLKPPDSPGSAVRDVDSKPVMLNHVTPRYTEEARNNNIQGTVTLRVLVDATGAVKRVNIIRGLPDGLNEKAVEAAYQVKFKPAMKDGKPVPYSMLLQMTFNLR